MELARLPVPARACTALAAPYGAALADDSALAPLQVPAKTLPVPADASPELQKIIAAPRNSAWSVLWKTGEGQKVFLSGAERFRSNHETCREQPVGNRDAGNCRGPHEWLIRFVEYRIAGYSRVFST